MAIRKVEVGDILQAIIRSDVLGQVCLNVLYYQCKKTLADQTYEEGLNTLGLAIGDDSDDNIVGKMLPLMGDNCKVVSIQVQRVYPERNYYVRVPVNEFGTAPTVCNAPNISAVITKQGEQSGRGKNGGFHLAGLTDQHYELGNITDAGINLLNQLGDKLNDPLVADGGDFVYVPGMYNPEVGTPLNFNQIVAVTSQRTLRVMRRRTVGLGI